MNLPVRDYLHAPGGREADSRAGAVCSHHQGGRAPPLPLGQPPRPPAQGSPGCTRPDEGSGHRKLYL
jgi:hypothetical protein